MTFRVGIAKSATVDLEEYADFIRRDSQHYADVWLAGALRLIESLNEMPTRFAVEFDAKSLGYELRAAACGSHKIYYTIDFELGTVTVVRVWHTARQPLDTSDFPN
jgi:plasmid stabilization system protein ParE